MAPMMKSLVFSAACVPIASSLTLHEVGADQRPVTKVVDLLKNMQKQLDEVAAEDKKTYEKFQCWCNENNNGKAASIAEAQGRIRRMTARIEQLSADSARLEAEYTNHAKDVEKYNSAMDTAMALRKKVMEKFKEQEDELLENLGAVEAAGAQVNKAAGGGFLQSASQQVMVQLQKLASKPNLSAEVSAKLNALIQQEEADPGSNAISGVLTGLELDFEGQLKVLRFDEEEDQRKYEGLTKAKRDEIQSAQSQIDQKKDQKASADEEIAHKKQDIKDTKESIEADSKFAGNVKETCGNAEKEYDQRTKTRAEETEAISKTMEILDADSSHEVFGKTLSFIQGSSESDHRQQVVATLLQAGRKGKGDSRLVALAMSAKLDSFTRVKASIDEMIAALTKESQDEVKHKDWCVEELHQNDLVTQEKTRTRTKLAAKMENIKSDISEASTEIEKLKGEVSETQKQLQLAAQNREEENKEFQLVVREQRETQRLLSQAVSLLGAVYNAQEGSLVQVAKAQEGSLVQVAKAKFMSFIGAKEAPPSFKTYEKSSSGTGVMSMLQQLIYDSKAMETEALAAERSAQSSYESTSKETSASLASKTKVITDKSGEIAKAKGNMLETKESQTGTVKTLSQLATTAFDLHESCDFVMKEFDAVQAARSEEIDALKQAKSYLAGAK
eukprot:TRINITY_DN795_c0_g1_i1.p1 TRINITY_DN795_c0_g1~~TRINITY_DN795_c0_g1_i1.p1  ORF type:complete len:686 (-),score=225.42 TRINITY_DN795_c0_g1_i1:100-2118(-)